MRTSVVALTVITGLVTLGCSLNTDYFSEYRGKNLLGNSGFATTKWTTSTMGLVTSAPNTDYYMAWEPVGTGTDGTYDVAAGNPTAGPDGSAVYRVEIKNLIPDGDFETEADGATSLVEPFWTVTRANGGANTPVTTVSTSHPNNADTLGALETLQTKTINNKSLLFVDGNGGDTLSVDLKAATGSHWLANQYRFRLDFMNAGTGAEFDIDMSGQAPGSGILSPMSLTDAANGGTWDQILLASVTATPPVIDVSQTFTVTGASPADRWIYLGKINFHDLALVDNVRLLLANQELSAQLIFPSLGSGSLQLLPGTKSGAYVFTVQVKDDLTANQAAGPGHAPNRFYPSGMTVTVKGYAKNTGLTIVAQKFFPRPTAGWTSWTTLSISGGADFVDTDTQLAGNPALEVQLSPTNEIDNTTGGKDTGSILVASPYLSYNP